MQNSFRKYKKSLPDFFCESGINMIPKSREEITGNNIDQTLKVTSGKILNKILANQS